MKKEPRNLTFFPSHVTDIDCPTMTFSPPLSELCLLARATNPQHLGQIGHHASSSFCPPPIYGPLLTTRQVTIPLVRRPDRPILPDPPPFPSSAHSTSSNLRLFPAWALFFSIVLLFVMVRSLIPTRSPLFCLESIGPPGNARPLVVVYTLPQIGVHLPSLPLQLGHVTQSLQIHTAAALSGFSPPLPLFPLYSNHRPCL